MNTIPPVLYRGSVKNVRGVVSSPHLLFEYSDRFSVFDWGEMPDQLEDKGVALAVMGKCFFKHFESTSFWRDLSKSIVLKDSFDGRYLKELWESEIYSQFCETGLPHHAVLHEESESWKTPFLEVKNVEVHRPNVTASGLDYSFYQTKPINCLVPLEVIFRIGLVSGNSLSKRLGEDKTAWSEFGFSEIPKLGFLGKPLIDFSTKLEASDRYLRRSEALEIAGLSEVESRRLEVFSKLVALNLYVLHHEMGLKLWDGKIEVAFVEGLEGIDGERSFMLVDSVGIDELRLTYMNKSFSKEFLREIYKTSSWYQALENAKKEASENGGDFKRICLEKYHAKPDPLPVFMKEKAEAVYRSFANEVSLKVRGQPIFHEDFSLNNFVKRFL